MSAVVINTTELPKRTVAKIVHWTLGELDVNLSTLVVKVKETAEPVHHGRFWPNARTQWVQVWSRETGKGHIIKPSMPFGTEHLIVARIPANPYGKGNRIKRGGPPLILPATQEESLVCIVAHEGMHFHQFLHPREGRPRWSEVESEWAEFRLLQRYRERK